MRLKIFGICTAIGLVLVTPAFALERSGTVNFNSRFGTGKSSFVMTYNPDSRSFSRAGTVALDSGKAISYSVTGSCSRRRVCEVGGNLTGSMGRVWTVEMMVQPQADGPHAMGVLIAPNGKHIRFDRPLAARLGETRDE